MRRRNRSKRKKTSLPGTNMTMKRLQPASQPKKLAPGAQSNHWLRTKTKTTKNTVPTNLKTQPLSSRPRSPLMMPAMPHLAFEARALHKSVPSKFFFQLFPARFRTFSRSSASNKPKSNEDESDHILETPKKKVSRARYTFQYSLDQSIFTNCFSRSNTVVCEEGDDNAEDAPPPRKSVSTSTSKYV